MNINPKNVVAKALVYRERGIGDLQRVPLQMIDAACHVSAGVIGVFVRR
jgi:hypothetical protein